MMNNLDYWYSWDFGDLKDYGFTEHEYYIFKNKFSEFLYNKFGDKFFIIKKELKRAPTRVNRGDYSIIIDEMGYIDVIYNSKVKTNIPYEILLSGRAKITLNDMFDAIKKHKRKINLKSLENDLV